MISRYRRRLVVTATTAGIEMAPTTSLIHLSNATTATIVTATSTILIVFALSPGDIARQLLRDEEGKIKLHLSPISCMSSLRLTSIPLAAFNAIHTVNIIVFAITPSTPYHYCPPQLTHSQRHSSLRCCQLRILHPGAYAGA
jgi:hypothetical protein